MLSAFSFQLYYIPPNNTPPRSACTVLQSRRRKSLRNEALRAAFRVRFAFLKHTSRSSKILVPERMSQVAFRQLLVSTVSGPPSGRRAETGQNRSSQVVVIKHLLNFFAVFGAGKTATIGGIGVASLYSARLCDWRSPQSIQRPSKGFSGCKPLSCNGLS